MVYQGARQLNRLYSLEPIPHLGNNTFDEFMEEHPSCDILPLGKPGPSQQPSARRAISRHGTEVFGGLITPGNTPVKAPGEHVCFPSGLWLITPRSLYVLFAAAFYHHRRRR